MNNMSNITTNQLNGQNNLTQSTELNPFQHAKRSPLMKNGSAVDIITIIDRGLVLLGIKGQNVPSIAEKQMFVIELKSQYPNITIGELDFAFRLASRCKLDFEAETYQNFSMLYLNRMLAAYARYVMREYLSKTERPIEQQKQIPEISNKELHIEMMNLGFDFYKKHRQWDAIPGSLSIFKYLWDEGELEIIPVEFVVAETKRKLKLKFHEIGDPNERRELKQKMMDDDFMELQCRRMAVAIYFEDKIKNK